MPITQIAPNRASDSSELSAVNAQFIVFRMLQRAIPHRVHWTTGFRRLFWIHQFKLLMRGSKNSHGIVRIRIWFSGSADFERGRVRLARLFAARASGDAFSGRTRQPRWALLCPPAISPVSPALDGVRSRSARPVDANGRPWLGCARPHRLRLLCRARQLYGRYSVHRRRHSSRGDIDRVERRKVLMFCQCAAALLAIVVAVDVISGLSSPGIS